MKEAWEKIVSRLMNDKTTTDKEKRRLTMADVRKITGPDQAGSNQNRLNTLERRRGRVNDKERRTRTRRAREG
jgi:hypothetical protein